MFPVPPQAGYQRSIGGEAPSPEAYLFTYLRMIKTQGEGLPPAFVDALRRALAHYGITTLDPSPALEETLLWIYKSHQRVERQIAPILGVLERRLPRGEMLDSGCGRILPHAARSADRRSLAEAFPPSAIWLGKCAITASISRCSKGRGSWSMPRWRITLPIWR